ncbi:hypothetical protein [Nocardioides sp.]|uniref:hypothetical protein n=1 Tax=Nocardioides sp. TaxID=35761 RepID=UPI002726711D|nr:hypothetical protein [Nocardioides sp.]MDO9455361.1 hypothetical protein [Nocardioides sp.]
MTRCSRALAAALVVLPALALTGVPTHADAASTAASHSVSSARPTVYTVTGRVVRFGNGRPVRNVRVSTFDGNDTDFLAADLTNRDGRFTMTVTSSDDTFGIYVQGGRAGFQNGWLGCDKTLKPTFGDACTFGPQVGKIRIKVA